MPDYLAAVQSVAVNAPKWLDGAIRDWLGPLPEGTEIRIAVGYPEPFVVTEGDADRARLRAHALYEESFPPLFADAGESPRPGVPVENLLVVVRTPPSLTAELAEPQPLMSAAPLFRTPALEPFQAAADRHLWVRSDTPYGPSLPGPSHLPAEWFDALIDGELEPGIRVERPDGTTSTSSTVRWYFNREHAVADARHAGAPV